jgi:hypothetical protein
MGTWRTTPAGLAAGRLLYDSIDETLAGDAVTQYQADREENPPLHRAYYSNLRGQECWITVHPIPDGPPEYELSVTLGQDFPADADVAADLVHVYTYGDGFRVRPDGTLQRSKWREKAAYTPGVWAGPLEESVPYDGHLADLSDLLNLGCRPAPAGTESTRTYDPDMAFVSGWVLAVELDAAQRAPGGRSGPAAAAASPAVLHPVARPDRPAPDGRTGPARG